MRFVYITTLATITALVSATPVPSIPEYFQQLAQQHPELHGEALKLYNDCIDNYLRNGNKPEDLQTVTGKLYHDYCLNVVARGWVQTQTGAREAGVEDETDAGVPAAVVPVMEPPQNSAEANQDGGLNAFGLGGMNRALNAISKFHTGKQGFGGSAPIGGWAPRRPMLAW